MIVQLGISGKQNRGLTLVELILVVAVVAILATLAMAGVVAAKKRANESSVIAALKNISNSQTQYRVRYGTYGTISELIAAELIDESFLDSTKAGYWFAETGVLSDGFWAVSADPVNPGVSGDRFLYVDVTGVIRYRDGAPAGPSDTPVDG